MTHLRLNTRLLRGAGVVMMALLVVLLFSEHSHHFCSAMGHPDSVCPHGAAKSLSYHWPEAGDQFAAPPEGETSQEPVLHVFHLPGAAAETFKSLPPEAPQHIPIHV